ncbi:hypothetical protein HDU76_000670 [Blyttiomyces sp. JEL0837]|nr:hypothetical protein HDU76_000670 [Blyttiomyces sp. JEL0837]
MTSASFNKDNNLLTLKQITCSYKKFEDSSNTYLRPWNIPSTPDNHTVMFNLQNAQVTYHEGNKRRSADIYKSIYRSFPGTFAVANILSAYGDILTNRGIPPTEDDINFLRDVEKGRQNGDAGIELPKWERAKAASSRGLLLWAKGDRQSAAQRYRKAIELADSISEAQKEKEKK